MKESPYFTLCSTIAFASKAIQLCCAFIKVNTFNSKQILKSRSLILIFTLGLFSQALAQESLASKQARARQLFYDGKYTEALALYEQNTEILTKDKEAVFFAGICHLQLNQLNKAERKLLSLIEKQRVAFPEVLLFLAKTYHIKHDFPAAADNYKSYLKLTDPDNPGRRLVLEDLRRCSNGISYQFKESRASIENLGRNVNTKWDEFAPVVSPNSIEKLYFSSMRRGSTGGLRNNNGLPDERNGYYYSDIYSCTLERGTWTNTQAFDYRINSPKHEVLLDFDNEGSRLIYFKGDNLNTGAIFVDTFQQASNRSLRSDPFTGPVYSQAGDRTPHFANDTMLLFSSDRPGSYGGYDLYISTLRNGQWSPPKNMGPEINSTYDETTPFLARDGKTLYFSSNDSKKSVGQFDIFKTVYDSTTAQWGIPSNVGFPLNSARDDTHFRLTSDGFAAFFASSRKESYGMRDIYLAIFEEYQEAQTAPFSIPEVLPQEAETPVAVVQEDKKAEAITLYFNDEVELFNAKNTALLSKIIDTQQEFDKASILITGYSNTENNLNERLFEAVENTQKIQNYLAVNGINKNSIFSRSADIKDLNIDQTTTPSRSKFKIIINLIDLEQLKVIPIQGLASEACSELEYTKIITDKVSYKIQIASVKKPYTKKGFSAHPDPMMEKSTVKGYYRCTLGLFDNFESANNFKKKLRSEGNDGAFVVPYILGKRIENKEVKKYIDYVPELKNYRR